MSSWLKVLQFWFIVILGFVAMNFGAKLLIDRRQHTNDALIKIDQFKSYNADFIVLGNSRPACAVIPSVLEKNFRQLGLFYRVYNLAIPGATSSDIRLLYKNFVYPLKPKVLLIQAEPEWFEPNYEKEAEQRLHRLFLQPKEIVWMFRNSTVTLEEGLKYAIASFFPIVRYGPEVRKWANNFDFSLSDQSAYESELEEISDAGYRALDGSPKKINEPDDIAQFHLTDPVKVVLKTVEEALNAGAKVFVIDYPNYDYLSSPKYNRQVKSFFEKKGCYYLNYLTDSNFRDKALFFDKGHLNKKGATLLMERLAKDLSTAILIQ